MTNFHPYITGFVKFAILFIMGEFLCIICFEGILHIDSVTGNITGNGGKTSSGKVVCSIVLGLILSYAKLRKRFDVL